MKDRFYYLMLLINIITGFSFFPLAQLTSNILQGGTIAIIMGCAISCIEGYMLIYIYNSFKNDNIINIQRRLLGKFLGDLLTILYSLFYITMSFCMFRGLLDLVTNYMLPSTSIWFLSATLTIIPFIALLHDNKSFLNFMAFLALLMILMIIIQILISMKEIKIDYLKGTIIHSLKLPSLKTIAMSTYCFTGIRYLSLFNPEFSKINWKLSILIIIAVGIPFNLFIILGPVVIWGPLAIKNIQVIWTATSDTLSVELFIIERVLYILLPLILLYIIVQLLYYFYVGSGQLKLLITNNKLKLIFIAVVFILFIVLSFLIHNLPDLSKFATNLMVIGFIFHALVSVILFIITKVKEGTEA
jgi:hypothetical protein